MKTKVSLGKVDLPGVEHVHCRQARNVCEHRIPGLDGSFFQDMGSDPVSVEIWGSTFGDEGRSEFLTAIREKYTGAEPVIFVADTIEGTAVEEVLIRDVNVFESSQYHNVLGYHISLAEYTPPPSNDMGLSDVESGIAENAVSDFDSMVDGVIEDTVLGDFSEQLESVTDMESLLDALPTELLDGLMDLLGAGYEQPKEVFSDVTDAATGDEGLNVSKVGAGMVKMGAKLALTILTESDESKKADWLNISDFVDGFLTKGD